MLLYLSGGGGPFSSRELCDSSGQAIYAFSSEYIWKSDHPNCPSFRRTTIVESKSQKTMAQIDWDGSRPIYVDLGAGDEKLADELFQMAPHSGSSTLVFQTFREVKWELKDSSMALRSKLLATPLVHYRPHSQLTPDGKLDTLSKSARNRIAKDWLEINVLEYSTIPVAELLVHFLILDEIRKAYFGIEDPAPRPSPAPSETFTQKLKLVF